MKKKQIIQISFLLMLIIGTVIIVSQQHNMPYQRDTGFVFGTIYNITYQSDSNLKKEIEEELKKVDQSLSPFNSTSTISRVNRNEEVKVDEMFAEVFNRAMEISKETDGAFDITVAPLVNAWGFGFKSGEHPTAHTIDSLLATIGYQRVALVGSKVVKKDRRTMLDCSSIAKGYGCDRVAQLLRDKGISNFMVEIGGEVVTQNECNTQIENALATKLSQKHRNRTSRSLRKSVWLRCLSAFLENHDCQTEICGVRRVFPIL